MHKLSKGLKKKIKGKKGKEKEDDLFDPAILEQYRRDKAAAAAAAAATLGEDHDPSAEENGSPTTSEAAAAAAEPDKNQDSEEWQKFKLLTSGVDTILQKTQEDLGRIKKTSYYQRNKKPETPTPGEEVKAIVGSLPNNSVAAPSSESTTSGHKTNKWIGFEEGARYQEEIDSQAVQEPTPNQEEVASQEPEEPIDNFDQPDPEDEEDIFNTEYVDAITSGDLKFAYVPDSPTKEEADDPFDTSVVEKLVGPLPVIKKKKALVSIGAAVEILTAANAADQNKHQTSSTSRQRIVQPPKEIQLLCCFDDDVNESGANSLAVTPSANHLTQSNSLQPTPKTEAEPDLKDILAEFDVIPDNEPIEEELIEAPSKVVEPPSNKPELVDEEDFEFEALAYESLAKHPQSVVVEEEEENDPFDTSCVEKVLNKEPVVEVALKKAPPARPVAPPARPAPPPSSVVIAAIAAKIDRPSIVPVGSSTSAVPPLQPQDSFEALFLNDSPTENIQQVQQESTLQEAFKSSTPDPFDTSAVDPFDTSAADPFDTSAVDPFDTSAVDPFDTSAVDPFDTSIAGIESSSSALPAEKQLTSLAIVDDSPVDEEIDPFDTSAVEKILN